MGKIVNTFKQYPRTFWVANSIELFERWAWYGFYMLFANYLTGSLEDGGLEFSQNQKSLIMGVGTGILYFLPVITGAIADYFGYKKVLLLSFLMYISAFLLFPLFNTFQAVFAMFIYLAIGGAMFKPIISATVAKTTNDSTASIGFGIFYMMVNVGAFLGPLTTLIARKQSSDLVFYVAAALIACNFILILFYKEPDREVQKGTLKDALSSVFTNIYTVFKDWKFVLFLCIIAIFWAMYFQLFYTLPVFIGQWVDSSALFNFFSNSEFILEHYTIGNQMDPEFITNFDAMFIILFQIIVSSIVMRMKPLNSMMAGILVNAIGLGLSFLTQNVFFVIFSLFLFGIGEMAASPKVTEYIGRIAPKGKKALYMGFSFVPLFLGSMLAGVLSGPVYQATSDRTIMAENYAATQTYQISDTLTQNEYLAEVARQSGMETQELVQYFWTNENPSQFWYVAVAFGLFAAICLFFYDRYLLKEK
jgi:dipeptide/tripeptide permease